MLSLPEDLLFVWELANLEMSWHAPHFPEWEEKNFSKKPVLVGQKILILRGVVLWGGLIFGSVVQGIFRENRKLRNCNIKYVLRLIRDIVITH